MSPRVKKKSAAIRRIRTIRVVIRTGANGAHKFKHSADFSDAADGRRFVVSMRKPETYVPSRKPEAYVPIRVAVILKPEA